MANEIRKAKFLDSALLDEIEGALKQNLVAGVTTNPSLVAKAPKGDTNMPFLDRYIAHMNKIADVCQKYNPEASLSVEVFSLDRDEMIAQGREIRDRISYPNLAVKVPVSYRGQNYLDVVEALSGKGIAVNCTCCFTASQMNAAAERGARYVSLFYNRLIDHFERPKEQGGDYGLSHDSAEKEALGVFLMTREFLELRGLKAEIIGGSIRREKDMLNCWENGANYPTASYKLVSADLSPFENQKVRGTITRLEFGLYHPGTDASVEGFDKDLKEWMK